MILGLLDQLQIFSQLYLIELLGPLTGLGLLELWHLIYPRLLTGLGMLIFFTNFNLIKFQVRYLALFLLCSVIDGFKWFWMESLHMEYPVNDGVPQGSILGPTLFLLYINNLPDDVICNIAIYADDSTLCSKCDQASDLWQQLELASELESDLRDTVDWCKKWLVHFNAGKTQLVSFDRSDNNGSIDVKIDGSVLEEKSSFKMLGLTFSSKLDWGSYIISTAKTTSKKIAALLRSMKFLFLEVALYLYKSTISPYMEYCCNAWTGAPSCSWELLDKLQKRMCRTVGGSGSEKLNKIPSFPCNPVIRECF